MNKPVEYNGRRLGDIHVDASTHRLVFVARDINSLTALLTLLPETVAIGREEMSYPQFRDECLLRINAFYPNEESWRNRLYKKLSEKTKEMVRSSHCAWIGAISDFKD